MISIMMSGCSLTGNDICGFINRLHRSYDEYSSVQQREQDSSSPLQIDGDFDFSEEMGEGQAAGGLIP